MRHAVWITGANENGISKMSNVRLEPGFAQFAYYGPELAFGHAMGDKAYSVYNVSGDGAHWRHNARAYFDVGYWSAELMKPMLAKTTNHATDQTVQATWKKYAKLFAQGSASHKDPIYEAYIKRVLLPISCCS